ncbi:MAG: Stk1 family PASTA domain-containing Ser/Thr kinase [Actinomycetota bacterium]
MSIPTALIGGRYRPKAVVGRGGMAQVYQGTDTVLNRTVAIKVLGPQYASDDGFVQRFRREAQAAARLNHPNVVSVYDTGSDGPVHYIVMEYVPGRTLAEVLKAEGHLLPERAAEVTAQVASALSFAHAAGIVHRDVKPANIMITPQGEVKVMDFGIARAVSTETLTQTATVLGTASYLSPEQAQGEPVDARSDIYSLGVVAYEMLTGSPPFQADSPVAVAYKHVREAPTRPTEVVPGIPADLEAIVLKAMAKNPANRYASAQEMREDLERFLAGRPVLATPVMAGEETMVFGGATAVDSAAGEATEVEMAATAGASAEAAAPARDPPGRRRWVLGVVGGLVIGLVVLALAAGPAVIGSGGPGPAPSGSPSHATGTARGGTQQGNPSGGTAGHTPSPAGSPSPGAGSSPPATPTLATSAPATSAPTSAAPTTAAPTTAVPTTAAPTTPGTQDSGGASPASTGGASGSTGRPPAAGSSRG